MEIVNLPKTTVEVFVPSTFNFNQPMTGNQHEGYVKVVGEKLDKWFGGATCTAEQGFYQGVFEPITRVWSYADPTPAQQRAVIRLASWLRAELAQKCVLIVINDQPMLIF